jgi:hypothetical protein
MTKIGVDKCWNGILFFAYEIGIGINFYYLKFCGFQSFDEIFQKFCNFFQIYTKRQSFPKTFSIMLLDYMVVQI